MKSSRLLFSLLSMLSMLSMLFVSCGDDDPTDEPAPTPVGYFVSDIKYNNQSSQQFVCNEFAFLANMDSGGNDTLMFEGQRTVDGSYMRFYLIHDDIATFSTVDSLDIPDDLATGAEVDCAIKIGAI